LKVGKDMPMNTSIAMIILFLVRLAVPVVILFIVGEWLSRRESVLPFPQKDSIPDDAKGSFERVLQ